jgi:putative ATP-binding cassette transporter
VARALWHFQAARKQEDDLMSHLRGLTEGSKELKLHRERREAFLTRVLRGTAQRVWKHNIDGLRVYTLASSWGQLLELRGGRPRPLRAASAPSAPHALLTGYAMMLLYLTGVSIRRIEEMGEELDSYAEDEPKLPSRLRIRHGAVCPYAV